jgi:hypothetical protein
LVSYQFFHRAENVLSKGPTVSWWMLAPLPLLAAVSAARSTTTGSGERRADVRLGRAVVIGTGVALAYLCLSWAVYRWGVPVRQEVGAEVVLGLPLAAAGAVAGHLLGRPGARDGRWSVSVVAGVLVAVIGALLAPVTVQRGAESSFSSFPAGSRTLCGAGCGTELYVADGGLRKIEEQS